MTQKHLNRTERPAGREEGEGCGDPAETHKSEISCSDLREETTERPWFHGMRTARNGRGLVLPWAGWSVESLMKRIFKRIREIRDEDNCPMVL